MHKGWYKQLEEDDDNGFAQFGGYMEAKKAKLIKQVREQAAVERHSTIFKGVSIYVNGFTKPSAEELKTLMGLHGGVYHVYQMPSTTHIIASNLPNVKINKLGPLPIVKPGWIEDSITLGRVLDYTQYLLYTNQSRTQPKISFERVDNTLSSSKTASHPSFLSEFYGNSRLHLIATLGAEFKQFVNDLRSQMGKNHQFPGVLLLQTLKNNNKFISNEKFDTDDDLSSSLDTKTDVEVIMHIDMDCFFVSVGIRNRPELRGQPVAVTHSKTGQGRAHVDRSAEIAMYKERLPEGAEFRLQDIDDNSSLSEIASCSYEARKQGVKNGMFMGQALKLCPELRAIPYDFDDYKEVSKILYTTISEYTLNIEAVSCDEMYVNITDLLNHTTVELFAEHIRSVIKQRTGCPCSTGFGSNRLQARLATKRAKPDGQYYLTPSEVIGYFHDMPLAELPGVGRATLAKMSNLGLQTCGDVQSFSLQTLQKEIGMKLGETIYDQAAGIDKKPLQYEHERKSVSAEVNYGIRFQNMKENVEFLERLAEEVTSRLIETGMKAKCVTLKLMVRAADAPTETAKYLGHGVCDSMSKSTSLQTTTDDCKIIIKESRNLLEKLAVPFDELRGLGIQLSKLEKGQKMNVLLKNFLSNTATTNPKPVDTDKAVKSELEAKVTSKVNVKGRGRPSKNKSIIASGASSKNLSTFFKSTQKDRPQSGKLVNNSYQNSASLDMSVLQELPEDIRLEIMKEYNLQLQNQVCDEFKSSQTPGTSATTISTAADNKKPDSEEITKKTRQTKAKAQNITATGFDSLSHEDFMNMFANWFQSHSKPLKVDVDMLGKYFKQMAMQRRIEKLYIYAKYLHRNINEKNDCDWHKAYENIVGFLQEGW
ncbi:DNA repair protein Rev1 isoform X2 [Atheta coriaria]|uniref:DNA repair protein Rev1 isoform X2 n=1 Tax=Dalotia coriaria TaxID=877792 RepID=UPI0031F43211